MSIQSPGSATHQRVQDQPLSIDDNINAAEITEAANESAYADPSAQFAMHSIVETSKFSQSSPQSVGGPDCEHVKDHVEHVENDSDGSPRITPLTESFDSPDSIRPKWPVPVTQVPEGPCWVHEVEHAGQRILVRVGSRGEARLSAVRRERAAGEGDWTARLPELAAALSGPALAGCVIDGVVCALGPDGRSSRERLEQALAATELGERGELVLFVFDLPIDGGRDLRGAPLVERKRALRDRIERMIERAGGRVRYCEHVLGAGAKVFDRACELGLEGVISKRSDSTYASDPQGSSAPTWVAVECARRLSLVVGGFTAPHGSRRHLGALLLGSYDADGRLIYRGKVGSGFCEDSLALLRPQLEQLRQEQPEFFDPPVGSQARGVTWVRPVLGVDVEYGELTDKGKLRHARFKGLREPVGAANGLGSVGGDDPAPRSAPPDEPAIDLPQDGGFAMVRLSNPDAPLIPDLGLRKRDLADYMVAVAEWMLPHVCGRPLTVVSCPDGKRREIRDIADIGDAPGDPRIAAELPEGVVLEPMLDNRGADLRCLGIVDALGLLGLVEMNVVEIRTWGARTDKIDHPDRLVFALDPDPELDFATLVEAAVDVRDHLAEFGLTSFVKTSGGAGLHVVVPVQRRRAQALVERFCRVFAERMVTAAPGRYTLVPSLRERRGKVFLDVAANSTEATMVAPYSMCGGTDAVVSTPLEWDELRDPNLIPRELTLDKVAARVAQLDRDPWAEFFELRQWITKASFRRIGINPDSRGPLPPAGRRSGPRPAPLTSPAFRPY